MSGALYELALSVPWAITDAALEAMLSIAARDPLPSDEIARRMHGPKSLATKNDLVRSDSDRLVVRHGVGILTIDGPIYRYADLFTAVSGGVSTEALARDFQLALDDPQVRAIMLMIDSPGGEATGINELSDMIYAARDRKPIVAYVEGFGASAAYWIASAASQVIVDETALVGSIGTVMGVPDPAKRISRTIDFVSSQSPKKRPDPTTDAGRAVIQAMVDDLTEVFIAKVARNRGLDPDAVAAIEGGMLIGQQAIAAGLADAIGAEESVIAALAAPNRDVRRSRVPLYAQEETMPSFWDGFWKGAQEAGVITAETAPAAPALAAPREPAQPDPRVAQLESEIAALRAQQITAAAAHFAETAVRDGKALPAEQAQLAAVYTLLASDDATHPRETPRVAALTALVAQRPAHQLTTERVPSGLTVLPTNTDSSSPQAQAEAGRKQAEEYARKTNGKH